MRYEQVIVKALTDTIIRECVHCAEADSQGFQDAIVDFVLDQHRRVPDYLRFPMKCLTLGFGAWPICFTGRPFHRLPLEQRVRQVRAWRESAVGFCRVFIRFHEAFVIYAWYSEREADDDGYRTAGCRSCA